MIIFKPFIIIAKEKKDCKDVAHVVTIAWNETYKGIVPDSFFRWARPHLREKLCLTNLLSWLLCSFSIKENRTLGVDCTPQNFPP